MDESQIFEYDVYETDSSGSESSECSEEEGYEKQFVINQGMMYMTSCNINHDIIPLHLQGTVNSSQQCECYVGSDTNPGTINLNGVYDIYCDFFSFTSDADDFLDSIGSIFVINIDELNCSNYNDSLSSAGKGLIQCPTKLLIPIISYNDSDSTVVGNDGKNTINTDTLYITSILPTIISKLTLTFSKLGINSTFGVGSGDKFILKLIFKKTENSHMSSLLNKQHKTKTLF